MDVNITAQMLSTRRALPADGDAITIYISSLEEIFEKINLTSNKPKETPFEQKWHRGLGLIILLVYVSIKF